MSDTGKSQMLYRGITAYRDPSHNELVRRWSAHVPDGDGHRRIEADSAGEIMALIDKALEAAR